MKRYGLRIKPGRDFELVNPEDDPRYRDYVATYVEAAGAQGHHAGRGAHDGAHQRDGDRRAGGEARRCGRDDLRARGPVPDRICSTSG